MGPMAYQSISVDNHHDDQEAGLDHDHPNATGGGGHNRRVPNRHRLVYAAIFVALALIAADWARLRLFSGDDAAAVSRGDDEKKISSSTGGDAKKAESGGLVGISGGGVVPPAASSSDAAVPLPTGVNLASWFSLEDWFFVGSDGAVEVASPDDAKAAACLPPLHLDGSTGPRWNSETDLLAGLAEHYRKEMEDNDGLEGRTLGGYPNDRTKSLEGWDKAVRAINAHRSSFYDVDAELRTMNELGIKYVRVPLSWCFTDHDPSELVTKSDPDGDDDGLVYMDDEEVKEKFTCRDPFYDDVYWPAIPRNFLVKFLRSCAEHEIGATLDIHTYPGGTSIGTFSGVWPRYSRFWTHGDVPATDDGESLDVGRTLLQDFIGWLESLAVDDPAAFKGVRALSPMNEPAHLAGLYNGENPIRTDRETFLPPLLPDMAREYLSDLNKGLDSKPELTQVPDGNHLRVLLWLRDAVDAFRTSTLPSLGKELHVNVHESVFPNEVLPKMEPEPDYGLDTASMRVFGAWWRASTTAEERSAWAVLDVHHYHAWGPQCSGSVEGFPAGRYACSDAEARAEVLEECATWPSVFRCAMEEECGEGLRLASAEFSASTHHSVRHACNDLTTLKMMLESQVNVAKAADVELFWWSYKMPYGGAFRRAWSLKHLLYLLGVLPQPDEELFHCGDHIPPPGEPKDGSI